MSGAEPPPKAEEREGGGRRESFLFLEWTGALIPGLFSCEEMVDRDAGRGRREKSTAGEIMDG